MREINLANTVSLLPFFCRVTFSHDNKLTEAYHHLSRSTLDLVRLFAKHHPLLAPVAESSVVPRSYDVEQLVGPGNCSETPSVAGHYHCSGLHTIAYWGSPHPSSTGPPRPAIPLAAPSTCSVRRVVRWGPFTNTDLASTANQFHKLSDSVSDFEAEKTRPGQSKPISRKLAAVAVAGLRLGSLTVKVRATEERARFERWLLDVRVVWGVPPHVEVVVAGVGGRGMWG